MSTPVMPRSIIIFKMIREFEKTNKKDYTVRELFTFAHKVLEVASKMDNEQYWIMSYEKYGPDFSNAMSRICDLDVGCFHLNEDKLNDGGKEYAEKVITNMPDSFLQGAIQVLNDELKEIEDSKEILCD